MKVLILAGGLGTRLREETEFKPKPMVPIGDFPILWHIMKYFACFGLKDFIIATGYRGEIIADYFLRYDTIRSDFSITLGAPDSISTHSGHEEDWKVTIARTGLETTTGGRLEMCRKFLDEGPVLITYGDGLADLDLAKLMAQHRSSGQLGTISATRPMNRFGVLDLNADGELLSFAEKPLEQSWVNIGFMILEPGAVALPVGDVPLETGLLPILAEQGQLGVFRHEGFWQPMDTYREFKLLNSLWQTQEAPWKVWSE